MARRRIRDRIDRETIALGAQQISTRVARRLGWDVVRADYYSPIADVAKLPESVFTRQAPMHGVDLRLDSQLALLEQTLRPYLAEWDPPLGPPGDALGFYLCNRFYGPLDAHVLYALIRSRRPRRLFELGSGFSTIVACEAGSANSREGAPLEHTVFDPHPSYLLGRLHGRLRQVEHPAGGLDVSVFAALGPGDFLFVDTTHAVKIGGDVVHLVLDVLPTLARGVVVHFHDIFRPFEYPRAFYRRYNVHWQEHYLLEAFLAYNPGFQVLCANHALARLHPDRIRASVPTLTPEMVPSGFWFEKL